MPDVSRHQVPQQNTGNHVVHRVPSIFHITIPNNLLRISLPALPHVHFSHALVSFREGVPYIPGKYRWAASHAVRDRGRAGGRDGACS